MNKIHGSFDHKRFDPYNIKVRVSKQQKDATQAGRIRYTPLCCIWDGSCICGGVPPRGLGTMYPIPAGPMSGPGPG